MLQHAQSELVFETRRPGFIDISRPVAQWLRSVAAERGLLTVFVRHTSASLTIQENADPAVQVDLLAALDRLAPRDADYQHNTEGPDDMPAHIRAMLTSTSLQVPVMDGRMVLGTWQALYLIEHRDRPHTRSLVTHFIGEMVYTSPHKS